MPLMHGRECVSCGNRYDVVQHTDGTSIPIDNDYEDESDDCPKCGCPAFVCRLTGVPVGIDLGGEAGASKQYPHFNRGLGCWVSSAQHLRELCKERNLVPLGSDDYEYGDRAARREFDRKADEGKEILRRQAEEPWYREMMDKTKGKRENLNEFIRERRLR